jgi:hypothetical protein
MRIFVLILGVLAAASVGFLFPGIPGALAFGGLVAILTCITNKWKGIDCSLSRFLFMFPGFSILGFAAMHFFGLFGANPEVHRKLALLRSELEKENYKPSWVIISQKRSKFYNMILPNSAKKSVHLEGLAIDIYVFDVDGDGVFNKVDIAIMEKANNRIEKKHPELIGAFGDYTQPKHGYLTRHMIHLDIRGKRWRYSN